MQSIIGKLRFDIPWVLMQAALAAQLSVPRTHSLMSMLQVGPSNLQAHERVLSV